MTRPLPDSTNPQELQEWVKWFLMPLLELKKSAQNDYLANAPWRRKRPQRDDRDDNQETQYLGFIIALDAAQKDLHTLSPDELTIMRQAVQQVTSSDLSRWIAQFTFFRRYGEPSEHQQQWNVPASCVKSNLLGADNKLLQTYRNSNLNTRNQLLQAYLANPPALFWNMLGVARNPEQVILPTVREELRPDPSGQLQPVFCFFNAANALRPSSDLPWMCLILYPNEFASFYEEEQKRDGQAMRQLTQQFNR